MCIRDSWFIGNIADIFIVGGALAAVLLTATVPDRGTVNAAR